MATIPEALNTALHHHQAGRLQEAEILCRQILQARPDTPHALNLLGVIAAQVGRHDITIDLIGQAIALEAGNPVFHNNLGEAYRSAGRLEEARVHFEQALALKADFAEAHNNLGNVLNGQGKRDEAVVCYERAIALKPDYADAYSNLGTVLNDQGNSSQALVCYRQALALNPSHAGAHNNLGIFYKDQGKLEDALACYRRAVALQPSYAQAHWNQSLVLLQVGNFKEGWSEFEWRWQTAAAKGDRRAFTQPLWDGSEIAGRTILLHAEQGRGDTLQFIRYAPLVANRGARVIVECQSELKALFESVEGITCLVAKGEPLPDFDLHAPLLSLPPAFATTLDTIPSDVPYLAADPQRVVAWRNRLKARKGRFRVGVAWAGRPDQKNDRNRSCPVGMLAPLAKVRNVSFYSLQKGDAAGQAANPPEGMTLIDLTEELTDFAETAALIRNLDLVITVDTAVAHLAGAMGKPVWTVLCFVPDWRWLMEREDCPWYPTMRLFRQQRPGDWPDVFARVAEALGKIMRRQGK